jgi:hypothetical protein
MMEKGQRVSVVNLSEVLKEIIGRRNFASFPSLTEEVLRSQNGLAKFSDIKRDIVSISLNTLKSNANEYLPGGFKELDNLRRTALDYRIKFDASMQTDGGRRTKVALQRRVDELEEVERRLNADLFHISEAFREALIKARGIVDSSKKEDLRRRWRDEESALLAMASMVRSKVQRVA